MSKAPQPVDPVEVELLDRVLSHLDISVEPFTYCLLSSGWRLNLPPAQGVMLHFVLQGRGLICVQRKDTLPVDRHWLAVVPQGMTHALESSGGVRRDLWIDPPEAGAGPPDRLVAGSPEEADLIIACGLIHVRYGETLDLFAHLPGVLTVDLSDHPEVRSAFDGLLQEQSNPGPGSQAMQAAQMSQCLVLMLRNLSGESETVLPWLAALRHPRLTRALDQILESPQKHHTVDSLADVACMSRSSFARRFAEAFGTPPMSFVQNVRLKRAARLLDHETLPVDDVARLVGYSSRSHFSQAFKKRFGLSPVDFREANE